MAPGRGGAARVFGAGHVINCTGPGGDFSKIAIPLIADLRERRLAVPDALGVGLETKDCAVINGAGEASPWLFALGPLTRPACTRPWAIRCASCTGIVMVASARYVVIKPCCSRCTKPVTAPEPKLLTICGALSASM